MNIKKSNIITAVLCTAALSVTSFCSGYAAADTASGIQYNSQGKIIFDNGTEDAADDVVFDAADFLTIDNMVMAGKTNIKNELNKYGTIEIGEDIPEFDMLAASVAAISDGTDATAGNILSGKKALVGKSIVTGSMADHSGTSTSTSQIKENGTTAEITIPGGYYDEDSKITVPIDVIKKLPTINSNLRPDTVLFNQSSTSGVVQSTNGNSNASVSYTFNKDYSAVVVIAVGSTTDWNTSGESLTSAVGLNGGGTGTVTCTAGKGTVITKNGFFVIENIKAGAVVTISYGGMVGGHYHRSCVRGIIIA